jgi:hypothetical protein
MTESKSYHLPKKDRKFTFDEIEELILAGKIQRSTKIWEKSLTDWIKIIDHPDFSETFEQYDKIAKDQLNRALGLDEETQKKREMRKMFDDVEEEKYVSQKSGLLKWVVIGFVIVGIPFGGFFILELMNKKPEVVKEDKKEVKIDDINLDHVKFGSGVMKIDSVKGVTVKKVEKSEEDEILKEVLLEIKKEEKAKAVKDNKIAKAAAKKKSSGLFDKVSEDELAAFRNSFLKKTKSRKVGGGSVKGSQFAKAKEELSGKQISVTIKKYSGSIKYCYNKALKDDTGIRGKMELTLHILGNGKVAKVINETPKFKGTAINRCITKQIKSKWQFPKFNGTLTTVTIPFILSAQ